MNSSLFFLELTIFSFPNIYLINSKRKVFWLWFSRPKLNFADAGLTGLTDLDLFGARITDAGTNYLKSMQHVIEVFVYYKVITFGYITYICGFLIYFGLILIFACFYKKYLKYVG
jgi:hypothetical protein